MKNLVLSAISLLSVGLAATVVSAYEVKDSSELASLKSSLKAASAVAALDCTTKTISDAFEPRTETYALSNSLGFLVTINGAEGGSVDVSDWHNVKLVTFSYRMPRQESPGDPPGAFEFSRSETYELRNGGTVLSKVSATHSSLRALYWPTRTNYISINQVTNCVQK